jgi:hypothetical protein
MPTYVELGPRGLVTSLLGLGTGSHNLVEHKVVFLD